MHQRNQQQLRMKNIFKSQNTQQSGTFKKFWQKFKNKNIDETVWLSSTTLVVNLKNGERQLLISAFQHVQCIRNIKTTLLKQKLIHKPASNSTRKGLRGRLRQAKPRTAPAAFSSRRVSHLIFLISLIRKANVQRLYWKYTEYSNHAYENVNAECNSK